MSKIGFGYGSEWHVLYYRGRHRDALDRAVLVETGAAGVEWLDHCPSGKDGVKDAEWKGVDFLFRPNASGILDYSYLRDEWTDFWPQRGNPPNWDAVGTLRSRGQSEWLLVEAKAHEAEMQTEKGCTAGPTSLRQIRSSLKTVGSALGVAETTNWTDAYYQYANRLAMLWFLLNHGIPARLLYIYFVGEAHGKWNCPATADRWTPHIEAQDRALGLDPATPPEMIEQRVHKIFLPVRRK